MAFNPDSFPPAVVNIINGVLGLYLPSLPIQRSRLPLLLRLLRLQREPWSVGVGATVWSCSIVIARGAVGPLSPVAAPIALLASQRRRPCTTTILAGCGVAGDEARPAASLMLRFPRAVLALFCGVLRLNLGDAAAAALVADFSAIFFNSQQICNGVRSGDEKMAKMLAVFASMAPPSRPSVAAAEGTSIAAPSRWSSSRLLPVICLAADELWSHS